MGRVALVTGGTRGIGAATAKALKKAGYDVAVNYGGNDEAAKAFNKETKIPVFKWDVGDYTACEQGIVNVENKVGPIEVLVNNAGISRDAMLQKMSHEQWSEVIRTNLDSLFNMTRPIINAMRVPGYVKTDLLAGVSDEVMKSIVGQIPVGRLGEAEEVARCVVFLAADEAAWITGSTLTINGGQFMD